MQRRLPWLLLGAACASPLIFGSFQFFGHVLFRLLWRIQLFFLCIYNTPEDERERSPMRFYFGTSNAQPVILFVSLLRADGSTAAAGWEKRAMMDFDGYVSLQKC
jgi:hypothetical protein